MSGRRRLAAGAAAAVAALVAAALAALGVIPSVKGRYANGDPELAAAYRAKETCSCLFVLGRDPAYCRAWTEASPDVATVEIEPEARAVRSRALLFWSARARLVSAREGCVLDP